MVKVLQVVDGDFYRLGTKAGTLLQLFIRNQFTLCEENFLESAIIPDIEIGIRQAVSQLFLTGRQGLISIMIDYERAVLNAIETEFCDTEVKACFFHMSQSLAFIPEADVIKCYNALLATSYYTDNEDLLAPLLDYFENTWVGKLDRRGKRKPPNEPKIFDFWRVRDRNTVKKNSRTGSMFEGEGGMDRFALVYIKSPDGKPFFHGVKSVADVLGVVGWSEAKILYRIGVKMPPGEHQH
ncbi:hypothetical protein QTP88_003346 [Uroleucon formosanum]